MMELMFVYNLNIFHTVLWRPCTCAQKPPARLPPWGASSKACKIQAFGPWLPAGGHLLSHPGRDTAVLIGSVLLLSMPVLFGPSSTSPHPRVAIHPRPGKPDAPLLAVVLRPESTEPGSSERALSLLPRSASKAALYFFQTISSNVDSGLQGLRRDSPTEEQGKAAWAICGALPRGGGGQGGRRWVLSEHRG